MKQIKNWLENGQDYTAGVSLYQSFGASVFYKNLFASGNDTYRKNKLLEELKKLCPLGDDEANHIVEVNEMIVKDIEPEKPIIKADEYPRYLKITEQISHLYLQANRAKHTLNTEKNQLVLLKTALVLKKLKRQITELYILKDYYDLNGCFPQEAKKPSIQDIEDKPKKLQLLRQSNAKAKARLKKPDCKNRKQTEALIIENNAIIKAIQIELGRLKA